MTLLQRLLNAWRTSAPEWHPFLIVRAWKSQFLLKPSSSNLPTFKLFTREANKSKPILSDATDDEPE